MNLAPWDELNVMERRLNEWRLDWNPEKPPAHHIVRECIDEIIDLLILAYVYGRQDAMETLDFTIPASAETATEMQKALFTEIAGETFEDRVNRYMEHFDVESIIRVVESEITRDYAEGGLNTAKAVEQRGVSVKKTWNTMMDGRVRDTHQPLEGITIDLNDYFVTFDGDKALAPGGFTLPNNNCNCRCWVTYTRR